MPARVASSAATMLTNLGPRSVFTASTGLKLPVIGLGTFLSTDESTLVKSLNAALELRYPLIDTAFLYDNEHIIGKVLKDWMDNGKLRREDIFITTKLPPQGIRVEHVKEFLEKQLKALQLEYVDLYLIHHAVGYKYDSTIMSGSEGLDLTTDHVAVWEEMENMVDAGLTKYIGLSNFNVRQIERIMENARIKPSNLQIELHIFQQSKEEQEYCERNGILITSYATMGSMGVPEGFFVRKVDNPLTNADVLAIAKTHNKTAAQVLLRHMIQSGIAVIPKSSKLERLKENIDIFDFQLSKLEMLRLGVLDRGEYGRRFILEGMFSHPEYPYSRKTQ
ncbi:aldose reductase A-like isoform X1 [Homalodisca vitripennis]|uniref:aldose reductase A-like isoform X1 n=1 Tax=Homalodisca vitripennis TaxID=197043 RepID=UPI001EEC5C8D|nr:aldose reductase A-like isoform X1 [Homalodisca vitripennis]